MKYRKLGARELEIYGGAHRDREGSKAATNTKK